MPSPRENRAAAKQRRRGRANERAAFLASRAGEFDRHAVDAAMSRVVRRVTRAAKKTAAAPKPARKRTAKAAAPLIVGDAPIGNVKRWVPIGPSVVRRGQAEGRPRVTGRVTDLAISNDGQRAYAGSGKGGVWYSEDAGATWTPVGGWASRSGRGGDNNAQTVGSLLVSFGATSAADVVLVGTGELVPTSFRLGFGEPQQGGVGVLAAIGPAAAPVVGNPWDAEAGLALLSGLGVFRLARDPAVTAAQVGLPGDRVLAATSGGLFLGTRTHIGAAPAHDEYTWTRVAGLDALVAAAPNYAVTDVKWVTAGAHSRVFVAVNSQGVAFTDDLATFTWVPNLNTPTSAVPVVGRMSLSDPVTNRMYVLGEVGPAPLTPTLWRITDVTASPLVTTTVAGVPPDIWGTQRDYDQAIAVCDLGATDRVYLGGSTKMPPGGVDWDASLWCFDVVAGPALGPSIGISRTGAPPAGDGADLAGLVGNNVHADIHVLRLAGSAAPPTQLWVGCDGGVFVSGQSGRVNTFRSRSTGIANLEPGYVAMHPLSSQFVATGCQDNGTQVRSGDSVWEERFEGDGGGVVIHPTAPQYVIGQYNGGTWLGMPTAAYLDPLHRVNGGRYENSANVDREAGASQFYSGAAAISRSPTTSRVAIGTNRVWISDDIGTASTWRVLPAAPAATVAADPRPGGVDQPATQNVGVPPGNLGPVVALRWVTASDLLAVYNAGLVRYIEAPAGSWAATTLVPSPPGPASAPAIGGATVISDVAPVPGTSDFYVASTGAAASPAVDTLTFYDAGSNTFVSTGLRHALDSGAVQGPLDPAYAVVVDPTSTSDVYVGTVSGVWHGVRSGTAPTYTWAWTPFVNGLPQATVQDLAIWTDPNNAPNSPRLMRAAVQSRGVWEVDLAAATEPQRTYLRVHDRDDRRMFPTQMANPRLAIAAAPVNPYLSPDITIRPANNVSPAPTWQLPATATMANGQTPFYELWTFQTAFRWSYPSLAATGVWSDQFGDLVELHRTVAALPAGRFVDKALWNVVVGNGHIGAGGTVTASAGDPLAVYRAPWQSAMSLDAVATEVDLTELVVPPKVIGDVWLTYAEPSVVDVLIHHRDVTPLPPQGAFAILLWQFGKNATTLLNTPVGNLTAYAASQATGSPLPTPAGWNVVMPSAGATLNPLPVSLDARMPRAVPVGIDLSAVPANNFVLFLAIAGSNLDAMLTAPFGAPATVADLVKAWPNAALRLVKVTRRPP